MGQGGLQPIGLYLARDGFANAGSLVLAAVLLTALFRLLFIRPLEPNLWVLIKSLCHDGAYYLFGLLTLWLLAVLMGGTGQGLTLDFWAALLLWLMGGFELFYRANRITIRRQTLDLTTNLATPAVGTRLTLAIIGEPQLGVFSSKRRIKRLVQQLNALPADAVLVTGDWLAYGGADLIGRLMLLKSLNKPCYTTLSLADYRQLEHMDRREQAGDYMAANERLTQVLATLDIKVLDNLGVSMDGIRLIGLAPSLDANRLQALGLAETGQPSVVLTHDASDLYRLADPVLPAFTSSQVALMITSQVPPQAHAPKWISQVWLTRGLHLSGAYLFAKPSWVYQSPSLDLLTLVV